MVREIVIWPDDRLAQVAAPVPDVQAAVVQDLIRDLLDTCSLTNGLGLAAPQVGVSLRVIVVDRSPKQDGTALTPIVNPVIEALSAEKVMVTEGCLSVPGYSGEVVRAKGVHVSGYSATGEYLRFEVEGLPATAFQHEIDHLDGIVYVDHLSSLKRDIARRKMRKVKRDIERGQARAAEIQRARLRAKLTTGAAS